MAEWYWMKDGQKNGPVDTAHLKQLARTGQIQPTDTIWREGLPNWVLASQANGLEFGASRSARGSTSVATAPARPSSQQPVSSRGIIKYRCVHCGGGLDSEGRFAGKQDTCPMCGKATPVPPMSTVGLGAFFLFHRKAIALTIAACIVVTVGSVSAWLALRDTWERDHGPELRQISEQVVRLAQAGEYEQCVDRCRSMQKLINGRELADPELAQLVASAETATAEAEQRLRQTRREAREAAKLQASYVKLAETSALIAPEAAERAATTSPTYRVHLRFFGVLLTKTTTKSDLTLSPKVRARLSKTDPRRRPVKITTDYPGFAGEELYPLAKHVMSRLGVALVLDEFADVDAVVSVNAGVESFYTTHGSIIWIGKSPRLRYLKGTVTVLQDEAVVSRYSFRSSCLKSLGRNYEAGLRRSDFAITLVAALAKGLDMDEMHGLIHVLVDVPEARTKVAARINALLAAHQGWELPYIWRDKPDPDTGRRQGQGLYPPPWLQQYGLYAARLAPDEQVVSQGKKRKSFKGHFGRVFYVTDDNFNHLLVGFTDAQKQRYQEFRQKVRDTPEVLDPVQIMLEQADTRLKLDLVRVLVCLGDQRGVDDVMALLSDPNAYKTLDRTGRRSLSTSAAAIVLLWREPDRPEAICRALEATVKTTNPTYMRPTFDPDSNKQWMVVGTPSRSAATELLYRAIAAGSAEDYLSHLKDLVLDERPGAIEGIHILQIYASRGNSQAVSILRAARDKVRVGPFADYVLRVLEAEKQSRRRREREGGPDPRVGEMY